MNDLGILINTLYHPDERIRTQAEAELRRAGSATLEALIAVLNRQHRPPKIKRATGFLSFRPTPQEIETDARRRAIALLEKLDDGRAAEALAEALRDDNEAVSLSAALALGRRGDWRAVKPLIEALYSQDYVIRADAADLLGALGDRQAVDALIRVMLTDGQPIPRWQAMRALGRLRDARALPPLIAMLENMLALPIDQWALPDMEAYSEDELLQTVWTTCTYAIEALGAIGSPQALPVLERLTQEAPAHTIQDKAARCLTKLRSNPSPSPEPAA